MSSVLTGAWELLSDSQKGMAIFTDTHFSIVVSRSPDTSMEMNAEPATLAAAGTYRVSDTDSMVIFDPVASPDSKQVGTATKWQLTVIGNKAKTRKIRPNGSLYPAEVWQRVS